MGTSHRIENVRGGLSAAREEEMLALWAAHGALTGDAARERLSELVCLLIGDDDQVRGACSAYPDDVALIGGRRFWIYRRFLVPGVPDEAETALLVGAFDALEAERPDDGPVGLCLLLEDPEAMRRHPEAVWPDSQMLYAGYVPDGRQARIRYFDGARIA